MGTGRWQSVTRPVRVTRQVPPGLPAVNGLGLAPAPLTAALGFVDALALGCGDALGLGVTLAWATPVSMRLLAAVTVIRAGQRPMPDGLFHFNAGPPQQIRHRPSRRAAEGPWSRPVRVDNDVTTSSFMLIRRHVCVKVEK
jgi:hypothetical protein